MPSVPLPARVAALIAIACSVLFVVLGSVIARRQSATSDEVPHIAAGVGYVHGDMRLNREHPPLVKWLAGEALGAGVTVEIPAHVDGGTEWAVGHALLHRGPPGHALQLLGRARMPVVWLSALLPLLAAAFAFRLGGVWAACGAAVCAACSPLWLAHGTLVTTDAAVSVFTLACALAAHRWLRAESASGRRPSSAWLVLLAVSAGLGMASKYSMVVAAAGVGSAAFCAALVTREWRRFAGLVALLGASCLLGAAFAWGMPPSLSDYLHGVTQVGFNHLAGYPFYAFGELFRGAGSRPTYFVEALLVKVEWPVLVLAALGLARLLRSIVRPETPSERRDALVDAAFLTLVPGLYLAVISLRAPALGVRYVLPVLPFAFVLAGLGARRLAGTRVGVLVLSAALALEALALTQALEASPIAWFNGFPCATGQVPACLDDSNVDWGQSAPALGAYRDAHARGAPLRVFQFTHLPLAAYLTAASDAAPIELARPYRSLYAVSLHSLARMPPQSPFVQMRPRAVVGGSFAIFDLRPVEVLPAAPP
ncbi:MAG TPA: glycosyltransferase family 39 protein [Polyangiales bacterium]|jgi:4-amino-4-deoxy-L-arabinose transferase-like glycosyltransferase|nr:glycosyltransferase family 39 protein [Polyangiales bacterium]